jgi:hypothetical protein
MRNILFYEFFTLIVFFLLEYTFSEHCGFDHYKSKNLIKYHEENDKDLRFLQNQAYDKIRIYYDYATLDNQTTVSDETKSRIKLILSNTKAVLENLIQVKRLTSKAKFQDCDPAVQVSDLVKTTGVEADLVIFPYVDPKVKGKIEAYASACIISGKNNRPVAGLMAFTQNLNTTKSNWLNYYVSLSLHELTHVLVFNPDMFSMFVDSSNEPIPIEKIMSTKIVDGIERKYIITPKVLAAAKKHYNCENITGVELENQGGQGTVSSHWEARTMLSDYMIGVSYDEMTISDITLAFMEDSGWYKVNYYTGGLFRYGKNGGCGFLTNKCVSSSGSVEFTNEFCNKKYAPSCTASKMSKGICFITNYESEIDANFRYFPTSKTGGLSLADYCPVTAVPTNSSAFFPWSCSQGFALYPPQLEESISRTSGCFISSLVNKKWVDQLLPDLLDARSICYQYDCDYTKKRATVKVGNYSVQCPIGGGYVTIENYEGKLMCPDFNQICTNNPRCSNMIDCAINRVLPVDYKYDYVKNDTNYNITTTYEEIISLMNGTVPNLTALNDKYNKSKSLNFTNNNIYFRVSYLVLIGIVFFVLNF